MSQTWKERQEERLSHRDKERETDRRKGSIWRRSQTEKVGDSDTKTVSERIKTEQRRGREKVKVRAVR